MWRERERKQLEGGERRGKGAVNIEVLGISNHNSNKTS